MQTTRREIDSFVSRKSFKYNDVIDSKIVNLDIWHHFRFLNELNWELKLSINSRSISDQVRRLISSTQVESEDWYQNSTWQSVYIICLSYWRTYHDDKKCWLIEDFFKLQSMKTQRALIMKTQTLLCKLHALITFAKTDKKYIDLLCLFNCFDYQFDSKNHFEVQINDDKWTAIILVKSFIFFNTTDVSVALHRSLIKTDWSSIELKSTFDLRKHKWQNDDKQVLQYCLFDASNIISVRSIMSDKLDRIKICSQSTKFMRNTLINKNSSISWKQSVNFKSKNHNEMRMKLDMQAKIKQQISQKSKSIIRMQAKIK